MSTDSRLRVTEVFYSLQGESKTLGIPTVFVRLTGCPLRCRYCDTEYAFYGGNSRTIAEIVSEVQTHDCRYVTVTGGEPLAQPACLELLGRLCDLGFEVSLETSGARRVDEVDARVSRVVDIKTPGSGEVHRNLWANLDVLNCGDQLKFVLCDRADYEWARQQLQRYQLTQRVGEVLFSPAWGRLDAGELAEWILADHVPVRMQLQLHKLLWGEQPGR